MNTNRKSPKTKSRKEDFTYKEYLETFLHATSTSKEQNDAMPYELGSQLAVKAIQNLRVALKKAAEVSNS
jgi:predicted HTH domain antitoxin